MVECWEKDENKKKKNKSANCPIKCKATGDKAGIAPAK